MTLMTDVKQLRRQSIGDVHHGGWVDIVLVQQLDDVAARLWLQLPLQQILASGKIGLEVDYLHALLL